jgi:hypothetical protein
MGLRKRNPRSSFIWILDQYPKRPLHPNEFYHIIDTANRDYAYNYYFETAFSGHYSPPTPIPRRSEHKKDPSLKIYTENPDGWNWWADILDAVKKDEAAAAAGFSYLRDMPDLFADTVSPLPPLQPAEITLPEVREKQVIDDPISSIGDLIHIIDKYDASGNYTIDIHSLSNIRPELVELNEMIGMTQLKQSILNQLIYFIQGLHVSVDNAGGANQSGGANQTGGANQMGDFKHTVIYGPPGTGKTEVAKIIGRMYSRLGILKNNVFRKVTRHDLVAGYLGQTAIKTKNVIQDCLGGVLFIDEAYSLSNSNDLDSFSKECIDTLCEALSSHKDDLMVIIAGYEEELERNFFPANRGLDSRFIWRFKIDTYSSAELVQIFRKKIRESGWNTETDDVVDVKWMEKHKSKFVHFGRDMEQLFFYTKIAHSRRVFGKSDDCKRMLTKCDIQKGLDTFVENGRKEDSGYKRMIDTLYV